MMNFWRAIEKHQACLSTDVAGSRKACPMKFPRHPKIIWFVPAKRLPNEFSQARKNHSAPVWQEPSLCGLGWAEGVRDEFSEGYKKHLACLATDVAGPMNCPRPAKISFRNEFSKEKDCPMNFPRLGKIIRPVSGSSSRLGAFGCAESFLSLNFRRPGKIIRSLCGRSPGFDGLDGQKACMMNFRRAIEKHQACLATDVAGDAAERLPQSIFPAVWQ